MLATREATGSGGRESLTVAQWSPLVDITEDEKEYLIKAELPDMKKEDVRLTVENDVLAISGNSRRKTREGHITGSNAPTEASCGASRFRRIQMGARCLPTSKTGCSRYTSRSPREPSRNLSRSRWPRLLVNLGRQGRRSYADRDDGVLLTLRACLVTSPVQSISDAAWRYPLL
jgi:hypothetical protein